MSPRRVIVGITGATGVIYGVRLLERLREAKVETHLVISRWGGRTLLHETGRRLEALADEIRATERSDSATAPTRPCRSTSRKMGPSVMPAGRWGRP